MNSRRFTHSLPSQGNRQTLKLCSIWGPQFVGYEEFCIQSSALEMNWLFGRKCRFHLQDPGINQETNQHEAGKMSKCCSETLVDFYPPAGLYILEDTCLETVGQSATEMLEPDPPLVPRLVPTERVTLLLNRATYCSSLEDSRVS